MSHDRSDLTEDNVLSWKERMDRLGKMGPKDLAQYIRGREDHTEMETIDQHKTITVADGETSRAYRELDYVNELGLVLDPDGEAKIQYTLSPIEDVTGGTARWVDWDPGAVTQTTGEYITRPVNAVRVVSNSGAATADVVTEFM